MTGALEELGFQVVGFDPDLRLLRLAATRGRSFCAASVPFLPLREESADLILLQNLLRPLLLMGELTRMKGIGRFLKPEGTFVVVDNFRAGHPSFIQERELLGMADAEGLELVKVAVVRTSRRLTDYLMQLGLVPRHMIPRIAARELERSESCGQVDGKRYSNIIFIFKK